MNLLNVVKEMNPSLVEGNELTPAERYLLDAYATPAAMLLGQVGTVLRTYMFNTPMTGWVDVWQRSRMTARMEWLNGPSVPVVAARLAAQEDDGDVSGVPGLRLDGCDNYSATLTWYGHNEPIHLILTRLVQSEEDHLAVEAALTGIR